MFVQLNDNKDTFKWKLTISSSIAIKSMYLDLLNGHTICLRKYFQKIKVSLKISIFMCSLHI
jgi:hypothetical protein